MAGDHSGESGCGRHASSPGNYSDARRAFMAGAGHTAACSSSRRRYPPAGAIRTRVANAPRHVCGAACRARPDGAEASVRKLSEHGFGRDTAKIHGNGDCHRRHAASLVTRERGWHAGGGSDASRPRTPQSAGRARGDAARRRRRSCAGQGGRREQRAPGTRRRRRDAANRQGLAEADHDDTSLRRGAGQREAECGASQA